MEHAPNTKTRHPWHMYDCARIHSALTQKKYWILNQKTKTAAPSGRAKSRRPTPGWSSKVLQTLSIASYCIFLKDTLKQRTRSEVNRTKSSLPQDPSHTPNSPTTCTVNCQQNELIPPNPGKALKQLVPLFAQNKKCAANEGDGTCL